ncbi:hypothetical protein GFD30_21310, partial [Glycomyces sp. NEAU-7082]|nr:hypothetical protein [Glycomyces albidus]
GVPTAYRSDPRALIGSTQKPPIEIVAAQQIQQEASSVRKHGLIGEAAKRRSGEAAKRRSGEAAKRRSGEAAKRRRKTNAAGRSRGRSGAVACPVRWPVRSTRTAAFSGLLVRSRGGERRGPIRQRYPGAPKTRRAGDRTRTPTPPDPQDGAALPLGQWRSRLDQHGEGHLRS